MFATIAVSNVYITAHHSCPKTCTKTCLDNPHAYLNCCIKYKKLNICPIASNQKYYDTINKIVSYLAFFLFCLMSGRHRILIVVIDLLLGYLEVLFFCPNLFCIKTSVYLFYLCG